MSEIFDPSKKRGISNCELKSFCNASCVGNSSTAVFVLLTLFTRHDHMFVIFRLNIGEFFFISFLLFQFCCAHIMAKQIVISFTDSLSHWKILNFTQFTWAAFYYGIFFTGACLQIRSFSVFIFVLGLWNYSLDMVFSSFRRHFPLHENQTVLWIQTVSIAPGIVDRWYLLDTELIPYYVCAMCMLY